MRRAAIVALACFPLVAEAQMTLEELSDAVDAETAEITGFRTLLTDPDPNRAMAAMRAMLASDEPLLVNLALEVGLTAVNPVMRQVALESYIASQPTLLAKAELIGDEADPQAFAGWMEAVGSLTGERSGQVTFPIGPYDETAQCYKGVGRTTCIARVASGALALTVVGGNTSITGEAGLDLVEGGQLKGFVSAQTSGGPVALTIDLIGPAQ